MNGSINNFIYGEYLVLIALRIFKRQDCCARRFTRRREKEHDLFVSCPEKIRSGSLQMRNFRLLYVFEPRPRISRHNLQGYRRQGKTGSRSGRLQT